MILVGLGANLPSPWGPPSATLEAALKALEQEGVHVVRHSRWYTSAPEPASDQPWYTNGIAVVETAQPPADLLATLLRVELAFGRNRGDGTRVARDARNYQPASRTLDLDLLAYDDVVQREAGEGGLTLPHPRMHARAFVLVPLAEVAPGWTHPSLRQSVEDLVAALPPAAQVLPIGDVGRSR
ncbi:MAG: 2-amino-4-hydroxy-6-hydroxymethyldihydropteridine diphosphokinase [Alphaproteobacteria bacterium]|nr:2-amino-4-hydroxy-6-hydroxymethyldihydropteridine diphosphokinase [Alphaproteobacteria bacterium]